MPYLLIRHKVNDFATWKSGFDEHSPAREAAGLQGGRLFRNADDPSEVLVLFEAQDAGRAKAFVASDDLRETMKHVGVSDRPDVYFLDEEEPLDA